MELTEEAAADPMDRIDLFDHMNAACDDLNSDALAEIRQVRFLAQLATCNYVRRLKIKHKREIFAAVRESGADEKSFLVPFGITTGEFCVYDVLNSSNR